MLLKQLRSLLAIFAIGVLFMGGSVVLRLVILPGAFLWPRRRQDLVTAFMKAISRFILGLLSIGGARFRRVGTLPTTSPVVVVANHQALLDICQITLLAQPNVPAFVTRRRYARFVPLVSACVRLLGGPVIDPRRDSKGALEAIRNAVGELPHGIVIFPEGHRSRDGRIQRFRSAGLELALRSRRLPVYLALSDGLWRVRRFIDMLFNISLIDAYTEVMGPFEVPAEPEQIPAFIERLRDLMLERLEQVRHQRGEEEAPAAA